MDKEDVVHIGNGILLGNKKKMKCYYCNNMGGPGGYLAKCNQLDRGQTPYDFTYMWEI